MSNGMSQCPRNRSYFIAEIGYIRFNRSEEQIWLTIVFGNINPWDFACGIG